MTYPLVDPTEITVLQATLEDTLRGETKRRVQAERRARLWGTLAIVGLVIVIASGAVVWRQGQRIGDSVRSAKDLATETRNIAASTNALTAKVESVTGPEAAARSAAAQAVVIADLVSRIDCVFRAVTQEVQDARLAQGLLNAPIRVACQGPP